MPKLSCITTCKGRLAHLQRSLPAMLALAGVEVVVVDYDCPQGAAAWAAQAWPAARIVRVEAAPFFQLSRARNLGAAAASGDWLLFLDADTLPSPALAEALTPLLTPGVFRVAAPRPQPLCGALLVSRADFEAVGGYDEAIEGWGGEDEDLVERLLACGAKADVFPGDLLQGLEHDERLRVQHYEVQDPLVSGAINHIYRMAKRDLTRLGAPLTSGDREQLYAKVKAATLGATAGVVEVTYRVRQAGARRVAAQLRYEISTAPGR